MPPTEVFRNAVGRNAKSRRHQCLLVAPLIGVWAGACGWLEAVQCKRPRACSVVRRDATWWRGWHEEHVGGGLVLLPHVEIKYHMLAGGSAVGRRMVIRRNVHESEQMFISR